MPRKRKHVAVGNTCNNRGDELRTIQTQHGSIPFTPPMAFHSPIGPIQSYQIRSRNSKGLKIQAKVKLNIKKKYNKDYNFNLWL
ncbi:hypothetical protein VNO80_24307 [Phaseolus coccineus]|uniref:Uncharacterized protein n=1 Tax=Phaseolus coccineus TaxID=3886 RepID=A0AAN9LVS5_PHACN